ncbi:TetR/AcrR family transcriptional regulator [Streptomyces sp. NBC_01275]|uniref:TetR/AcrR family transcriptional regulator n=1 Tax=Streptomyces sp. NBC_01275 TaxID=2903807 RepID=UPI0022538750|nr:TetR/AcrR family transcriptional regulator [Streptomyces sp. NBC_01275]MCX4763197.1 TetR/AcrR family transcriptional regulator [Streptomyces sp. NBC_01275]
MHIQDTHWSSASALASGGAVGAVGAAAGHGRGDGPRTTPLRVDAQRNLEHVLRAAREVFGELGYGAPMEDVARRARVGVGTVYRRFPSKDVLVRRIAEEETSRLTDQARAALGQEDEPWSALSRFLRTSVASGAGRLLPPQVLRVGAFSEDGAEGASADEARVPQQRSQSGVGELRLVGEESGSGSGVSGSGVSGSGVSAGASAGASVDASLGDDDTGAAALLDVVGQLVDRAQAAGELRPEVSVSDVLLVIATAAPSLPDPAQQAAASARLLDILLEGLRSRPTS